MHSAFVRGGREPSSGDGLRTELKQGVERVGRAHFGRAGTLRAAQARAAGASHASGVVVASSQQAADESALPLVESLAGARVIGHGFQVGGLDYTIRKIHEHLDFTELPRVVVVQKFYRSVVQVAPLGLPSKDRERASIG